MSLLVYNIEAASATMIASLDRHCLVRIKDGNSNIDPERSHLNRIFVGSPEGLSQSLKNFYDGGVKRPTAQAEKPYLRIVASASPEYFRPNDPDAIGTWQSDRLTKWLRATLRQLRTEFGKDLIFAELHLDEDTPHIHAVVAPTYTRKARKPGRKKRGETDAEFEERKAAALAAAGVRTVGRASHATLSKPGSFQKLREQMAVAVDHLGIEYGEDRSVNAPKGQSTREWVKELAAEQRQSEKEFEERARQMSRDVAQEIEAAQTKKQETERERKKQEDRAQAAKEEAERLERENEKLSQAQAAQSKSLSDEQARLKAIREELAALEPKRAELAGIQAAITRERATLRDLQAQAADIFEDARKKADAYWEKVKTDALTTMNVMLAEWPAFAKVPEPFKQAINNFMGLREAITETLQELGLANTTPDLGELDEKGDPPPLLELVFKRAGRKAEAKNELLRVNQPERKM